MFVEFAGRAGAGKTTVSQRALQILAETEGANRFRPPPKLRRGRALAHLVRHPGLIPRISHLEACQPDPSRPILRSWSRHIVSADLSLRRSRKPETVVISPEVLFHWLKKFPPDAQRKIAAVGLPLPDLLVLLLTSPADNLRRTVSRPRPIDGIERLSMDELEECAAQVAGALLRAFPFDEAELLLLQWGTMRAARRLDVDRLRAVLHGQSENSRGIDPHQHEVVEKPHVTETARVFGISLVRIVSSGHGTTEDDALMAADLIRSELQHL